MEDILSLRQEVQDDYPGGRKVVDPYRWLEVSS